MKRQKTVSKERKLGIKELSIKVDFYRFIETNPQFFGLNQKFGDSSKRRNQLSKTGKKSGVSLRVIHF